MTTGVRPCHVTPLLTTRHGLHLPWSRSQSPSHTHSVFAICLPDSSPSWLLPTLLPRSASASQGSLQCPPTYLSCFQSVLNRSSLMTGTFTHFVHCCVSNSIWHRADTQQYRLKRWHQEKGTLRKATGTLCPWEPRSTRPQAAERGKAADESWMQKSCGV